MAPDGDALVLSTDVDGLALRALTVDDVAAVAAFRWANRAYHAQFNEGSPPDTESGVREEILGTPEVLFGLWFRDTIVGVFHLQFLRQEEAGYRIVTPDVGGQLEAGVGYNVDEAHAGRGFATAATKALIRYAFSFDAVQLFRSRARETNVASWRVLEKAGLHPTGSEPGWRRYELRR